MPKWSNNKAKPEDAIAMLQANHQRVRDLFQAYEVTSDPRVKRELAEEACIELELHTQLEKNVFYSTVNEETDSKQQTINTQEELENILERAKREVSAIVQPSPSIHFLC
jgi:hypothetical protein